MSQFTSWSEAMEAFDGMLDDDQEIKITFTKLSPSGVLREMRPTDYRTALYDWLDSMGEYETDKWEDLDLVP